MSRKVKTWVWVLVGVLVVAVLCVVAAAGIGFYMFSRHVELRTVSPTAAEDDFESVRAKFKGQKPVVELDRHGDFVRSHPVTGSGRPAPEALNVLAFDPDDGKIVRVSIPFWLLRLKARGTVDFNGNRMDLEDLKLTVEDLERYGPALILDHTGENGERVLVWSQ